MAYKVMIVEDQQMPRQLLEIFIESSPNYTHLASISNAELALDICRSQAVDLILMDVMTEYNNSGLEAAEKIKKEFPKIKIIIVTSMPEYTWLERARKIGVDSFWYKDGDKENILSVMDQTMEGKSIYPLDTPKVRIGLSNNHEFTDRELDVLRELISGDSNTEIAERLNMTSGTVKWHISNMLQKTGFRTRTELAAEARSRGIVIREE